MSYTVNVVEEWKLNKGGLIIVRQMSLLRMIVNESLNNNGNYCPLSVGRSELSSVNAHAEYINSSYNGTTRNNARIQ